ncbi:MAG: alpha/beta hydrolase [Pirellulales bacterium]|nr:alpha/beta hydrolase [Pirellulales bacterium]
MRLHRQLPWLAVLFCSTWVGCASISPRAFNPVARLEDSVIFQATRYPKGNWAPRSLAYEDAWFNASDGTQLHGWYCPCVNPRATVLFCHGNAGNLSDRTNLLRLLHDQLRVAVMIFDYRGYGRSEGLPHEAGVLQDARAARAWLARREGIAERDTVLMGRSLGGAVAVDLAAEDGARGLVLESTFTSLPDVAANIPSVRPLRPLMTSRLDSLSKIGRYHGPLLHSHGNADQLIPFEQGQALFAAANEPKQFILIRGGNHNDPQTCEYYEALDRFLSELPPPSTGVQHVSVTYDLPAGPGR